MALKTKRCKKCGEVKALALYHREPQGRGDGRKNICARCYNAQCAQRRTELRGRTWDKINADLGSASISRRWGNRCLPRRRIAPSGAPPSA